MLIQINCTNTCFEFHVSKFDFKHYFTFLSAQPEIEEWSSWDEEAPTSIKIEGGNGNVSASPNEVDEEPDYFKDMAPTIRKTQKVCTQTVQMIHSTKQVQN